MVAALIIAAGRTAHKDRFAPLKEVGTIPAIQRIVLVFQRAGVERIVVACDGDADQSEKATAHMNVVYLHNDTNIEMFDHVKLGLAYLQDKCTVALITHVDVPLFTVETVRALIDAKGPVCIPSHNGRTGHPLLLRAEHFQTIAAYTGGGGLAGAVKAANMKRCFVEVADEGVLANIRYSDAYEHLLHSHSLMKLHPDLRIRIVREKPFYGPGAHQLLCLMKETGSLRGACHHMGISYSKGRNIISCMEEQLGYAVIESQQGGKDGGYSFVTEEGEKLMQSYSAFCTEAKRHLDMLFSKYFPE